MTRIRITATVSLAAIALAAAAPASAQTPEEFYKGKQIELAIGYPPAGSNDFYARLLARHLGKHIPGNPNIGPQNRPGAASFLTLAYVYGVAPTDGTVTGSGAPPDDRCLIRGPKIRRRVAWRASGGSGSTFAQTVS